MKKLFILLFVLPAIGHAELTAEGKAYEARLAAADAAMKVCSESEEGQSTAGMIFCADQRFASATKVLNEMYQNIRRRNKAEKSSEARDIDNRLVSAERAWVKFRELECNLAGISMLNGSGEGVLINHCMAETETRRARDLNELFNTEM